MAAFAAATILPMQSEALLTGLLLYTQHPAWLLIAVASAGNILGSCVNWWLGRGIERFKDRAWFPVSADSLERAQARYHRYGKWSLLLSWLPVIGDPITVVAGVMREKFPTFLLMVAIAKTLRYIVIGVSVAQYQS
jgi:membrane protein YqaA with SNARE-associated domain